MFIRYQQSFLVRYCNTENEYITDDSEMLDTETIHEIASIIYQSLVTHPFHLVISEMH